MFVKNNKPTKSLPFWRQLIDVLFPSLCHASMWFLCFRFQKIIALGWWVRGATKSELWMQETALQSVNLLRFIHWANVLLGTRVWGFLLPITLASVNRLLHCLTYCCMQYNPSDISTHLFLWYSCITSWMHWCNFEYQLSIQTFIYIIESSSSISTWL